MTNKIKKLDNLRFLQRRAGIASLLFLVACLLVFLFFQQYSWFNSAILGFMGSWLILASFIRSMESVAFGLKSLSKGIFSRYLVFILVLLPAFIWPRYFNFIVSLLFLFLLQFFYITLNLGQNLKHKKRREK